MEFPYQLTTFLGPEPQVGESVYQGPNGWYAQIALKRRFKIEGINEEVLIKRLEDFCAAYPAFTVQTGELVKPERMPVQVIEVANSPKLISFHTDFIAMMGDNLQSRYPERDGVNYLPHITAEYDGKMVIDPAQFTHKQFVVSSVWLLKDQDNEDSKAYQFFQLGKTTDSVLSSANLL